MRPLLVLAAAFAFVALVPAAATVNAASAKQPAVLPTPTLLGTWVGNDDGFARIVISRSGHCRYCAGSVPATANWVRVHPFGACTPKPCDWGVVTGRLAAANPNARSGIAFRATFDHDFALVLVTGHLIEAGTLEVDAFTRFTDGSGRSDYWQSQELQRRS